MTLVWSLGTMVSSIELVVIKVGQVAGIVAATIVVILLTRAGLRRWVRGVLPGHVYRALENAVVYSLAFLGGISALAPLGVDLTGLLVAGGVAGIVIGFASQQVFSNILSGLFLLVERPFTIGDPVTVEGVSGQVVDINIFSTRIRAWDGYIVRLPNTKVLGATIYNYQKTRVRRVELRIGISYGSSIEDAKEAIMKVIREHPFCLENPAPDVFVEDFADSAIVLNVRCWAPSEVWFDTKKSLLELIKREFDRAGVEIPFPQLDLHIRDSTTIPLALAGGQSGQPLSTPTKSG